MNTEHPSGCWTPTGSPTLHSDREDNALLVQPGKPIRNDRDHACLSAPIEPPCRRLAPCGLTIAHAGLARPAPMVPARMFDQEGKGSAAPLSQQRQSAGPWLLRFAPCARTTPANSRCPLTPRCSPRGRADGRGPSPEGDARKDEGHGPRRGHCTKVRFAYARPERTANDTDRWLGDRQISGWLKAVFERCHNRSRLLKKLLRLGRGVGQGNILLVSCLSLQLLVKIGHLNAVILRARSSHCLLAEFFNSLGRL